jgi:hypothetical protein
MRFGCSRCSCCSCCILLSSSSSSVVSASKFDMVEYSSVLSNWSGVCVVLLLWCAMVLEQWRKSVSARSSIASNGRKISWYSCGIGSVVGVDSVLLYVSSMRDAMVSNLSDVLLNSAIVSSISLSRSVLVLLVLRVILLRGISSRSTFRCFLWIRCRVESLRLWGRCVLFLMSVGECKRVKEDETVLVVSGCRRVVRLLYRLADDAPRPWEYGMCCGFRWLAAATSNHDSVCGCGCAVGKWCFVCVGGAREG